MESELLPEGSDIPPPISNLGGKEEMFFHKSSKRSRGRSVALTAGSVGTART